MSFVYPSFLLALFTLSIPIIVHLFNFRRYKKIYFTNVKFLKEVQQESKAKSTLKRYLILASRLLALGSLVMAFAQPYLPGNTTIKKGPKLLSLYIDNSFSMQSVNKSGNLLEDAKRKAREMVQAAGAGDKFQLLTNDFSAAQLTISKEQALDAISRVQLSPSVKNISEVCTRMQSNRKKDEKEVAYFMLSDFQKSTFNSAELHPDTLSETNLIYLENPTPQNIFIDSAFVESPYFQIGSTQKLNVKIRNLSEKEIENGSLKFFINKKQIAPLSFKVAPGSTTLAQLTFTCRDTGIQQAMLCIEDFPVTFDDTLYLSFRVNSRIPCLGINGKEEPSAAYLQGLLGNDSLFQYSGLGEQAIDYAAFAKSDLIIVNGLTGITSGMAGELKKFILSGGSVAIFPAPQADKTSYNAFLSQLGCATILQEDTTRARLDNKFLAKNLYEGVFEKIPENMDMPMVNYHYNLQSATRSGEEVLLKLANGQSFLSVYRKGKGKFYFCAAPLNEKNGSFAKHALFVPTLIRMAILSRPSAPLYYACGSNEAIDVSHLPSTGEKPMNIRGAGADFIPEVQATETNRLILTHGQPIIAGNYLLMNDKSTLEGLAFNYRRTESYLGCLSLVELQDLVKKQAWKNVRVIETGGSFNASLADISGGTKLWKLFVLLTLLFLLAETALIKFLK